MLRRILQAFLASSILAISPGSMAQEAQPPDTALPELGIAQEQGVPASDALALKPARTLELSRGGRRLSDGFSNWSNTTLRGVYETGPHVIHAELSSQREFDTSGKFFGIGDTYTINPDWFTRLSAGAGDGAFFLPRYRIDTAIHRKWLAERNLVTSLGLGYYSSPDGHNDRNLNLGLVYYFEAPWVAEIGVQFNNSNPGAVNTRQQFVALTYGRDRQNLITGRYAWGNEGYLPIGQDVNLVDFNSNEASLSWRHWIRSDWGFVMNLNYYHNPTYDRSGADFGVFHHFQ